MDVQEQVLRVLDQTTREDTGLAPAAAAAVQSWQQAGGDVRAQGVNGPAYWQSTQIEDAPARIAAPRSAIDQPLPTVQPVAQPVTQAA